MACHISGIYDVNRNQTIIDNDFSVVQDWYNSVLNLKLNGIIFHNNFLDSTCEKYQNQFIKFIKFDYNSSFNPNVFRYFVYNEYLKLNFKNIDNVFFTDISDVLILKNPFQQKLFLDNNEAFYCGDETEILDNPWMKQHCESLRNTIEDFSLFEKKFKNETLLNCGIIGGNILLIKNFIEKLWQIHENYNFNNKTNYTGDMGAFNYLIRTKFDKKIIHGKPVNTVFKNYDCYNLECWFSHK
jgi:hypothetical protein